MRCELPQFKRCFCCLPLRYGLIAWGYFKLILDLLSIAMESYELLDTLDDLYANDKFRRIFIADITYSSIKLFLIVTDFVLTTIFVIGGHTKNVELLRVFYYYSYVVWIIIVLLMTVSIGFLIMTIIQGLFNYNDQRWILYVVLCFCTLFLYIVTQTYLVLLLRSEILKLDINCGFRFLNNAADAEYVMSYKDDVTNGEKGIEAEEMTRK